MNKLQQYTLAVLTLVMAVALPACKKDKNDKQAATVTIKEVTGGFNINRYQFLKLSGTSTLSNPGYQWKVDDVVVSTADTLFFISDKEGNHKVELAASNGTDAVTATIQVTVKKESTAYSKNATKVFEYFPAPGQFVNTMPVYTAGQTAAQMAAKAEEAIRENGIVNLGGFGGFIVLGFDHAIINMPGQSAFKILGNAFDQWSEAGIIEVSMDANGNGLPDDEWYEIAGSEYNSPQTIKNYEITYHKPDENKVPTPDANNWSVSDTTYIRWTDNKGGSGYLSKNVFHDQPYYPQWKGASITLKGSLLTSSNIKDMAGDGTYFVSPAFSFGYADNWPNNDDRTAIRLDWAVDKNEQPAKLSGINFIRIYTGIRAEAGWLGEVSTEIMGVEDLRLK